VPRLDPDVWIADVIEAFGRGGRPPGVVDG
jgi:hypothetical protein